MSESSAGRREHEEHRVRVSLGSRSYDIRIGSNLLDTADAFDVLDKAGHAVVVTNDVVAPLLANRTESALRRRFTRVSRVTLPDGETEKNWQTVSRIFDALIADHCDRNTVLVALGGGVVGDITGFAAACYMRGIDYVQVPTTLLAQVDSSVGGKTAINHPAGKNMIGAFHQPRLVVADIATLQTLPRRELIAGLAEVIKYGAVFDDAFMAWIEANLARLLALDIDALVHVVQRSCEIKANVVAADEREAGLRALLNFGHTFAHAIEAGFGYGRWLHGEAVGCGMVLAAALSERLGLIGPERVSRLRNLVQSAGLPIRPPDVDDKRLVELMRGDKKAVDGSQRFILLKDPDGAIVAPAPEALVELVLRESRSW